MGEYRKYIEDDIRTTRTPMHREKLKEIREKYRKADAFDEIRGYSEDQLAYDLDDSSVLANVQYAIQKAVDETEDY